MKINSFNNDNIILIQGDGIDVTDKLVSLLGKGFADAIIVDPPYGCRLNEKYKIYKDIPTFLSDDLWRITWDAAKKTAPVLMFNEGLGYAKLVASQIQYFRYNFAFDSLKNRGHLNCNRMPMLRHGLIGVFYKKPPIYNTQHNGLVFEGNFANDMIHYVRDKKKELYPHERNIAVLEFLVRSYTNEGDLVYDFCMGSAPLSIACMNTNRKFIGVELIEETYDIAINRVNDYING